MDDEAADRPIDSSTQDVVYNIPEDIRPKMTNYRLEVIFWGVRDMKKIHLLPVLNPRIVVECAGVQVKSEVMENAKKLGNYKETHVIVELVTNLNFSAVILGARLEPIHTKRVLVGHARAGNLLSLRHDKGLRLAWIRLLQVRRDLHHSEHLRVHGATDNRGGLRRAGSREQIDYQITLGQKAAWHHS